MPEEYKPQPNKPASNYVVDLASLTPGEMQIECLNFEIHIEENAPSPARVVYQSPSVRAQPGFYFVMTQIVAGIELKDEAPGLVHRMAFNVLNEGRNKEVFKNHINMATMINFLGGARPMDFGPNIGFRFFEGADVIVNWYPDLQNIGTDIRYYIKLMGFNVRKFLVPEEKRVEYEG